MSDNRNPRGNLKNDGTEEGSSLRFPGPGRPLAAAGGDAGGDGGGDSGGNDEEVEFLGVHRPGDGTGGDPGFGIVSVTGGGPTFVAERDMTVGGVSYHNVRIRRGDDNRYTDNRTATHTYNHADNSRRGGHHFDSATLGAGAGSTFGDGAHITTGGAETFVGYCQADVTRAMDGLALGDGTGTGTGGNGTGMATAAGGRGHGTAPARAPVARAPARAGRGGGPARARAPAQAGRGGGPARARAPARAPALAGRGGGPARARALAGRGGGPARAPAPAQGGGWVPVPRCQGTNRDGVTQCHYAVTSRQGPDIHNEYGWGHQYRARRPDQTQR